MKNTVAALTAVAVGWISYVPSAQAVHVARAFDVETFVADVNLASVESVHPLDVINWKVGDTMEYNVKMLFGTGKSTKKVSKDEGTAIWLSQVISILGTTQTVEVLFNKADGKILKMIQNGREVAVPDDKPEIISSEETTITVPAGSYDCFHIVAKTKQIPKLETWMNPMKTCIDGSLKMIVQSTFGDVAMELTKFQKMP